jgi:hypothetical protein
MDLFTTFLNVASNANYFVIPESSRDMQLIQFLATLSIPVWIAVLASTIVRVGAQVLYQPPKTRKTKNQKITEPTA